MADYICSPRFRECTQAISEFNSRNRPARGCNTMPSCRQTTTFAKQQGRPRNPPPADAPVPPLKRPAWVPALLPSPLPPVPVAVELRLAPVPAALLLQAGRQLPEVPGAAMLRQGAPAAPAGTPRPPQPASLLRRLQTRPQAPAWPYPALEVEAVTPAEPPWTETPWAWPAAAVRAQRWCSRFRPSGNNTAAAQATKSRARRCGGWRSPRGRGWGRWSPASTQQRSHPGSNHRCARSSAAIASQKPVAPPASPRQN
mmetsp:Transcript_18068/g.46889  ORF Transcript_18068/g.46889 Transcript_18068/m.46889 type:complete len:256 (+) Transcript_18068:103-870(+)